MKRIALVVAVVVLGVGLWAFQPWRLFTSSEIDEPVPTGRDTSATTPSGSQDRTPLPQPRDVVVLSTAGFEDAEHGTDGTAKILRLGNDGTVFVRLEGLATSDGPDLHVWLSDQASGGDWGSYDDGRYVKLGRLKATHGNQNYEVPAATDLDDLRSVVIWCDRFNVAFGTAPITL